MSIINEVRSNNPRRRAIRDKYRDKFFQDLGIARADEVFNWEVSEETLQENISECFRLAREGHLAATSCVPELQTLFEQLSFGRLANFKTSRTLTSLTQVDTHLFFSEYFSSSEGDD